MNNDYGYNLGAASFESPYHARQRIRASAPVQDLTDYTVERQQTQPGTKVFTTDTIPTEQTADQLRALHQAKVDNSKHIREAMSTTVDNSATQIRLYFETMQERGSRGQILQSRA